MAQAEDFIRSVRFLMDVDLDAPDHTTLSRRSRHLNVALRRVPAKLDLIHAHERGALLHEDPLLVAAGPHFSGPSAGATLQGCRRRFIPRIKRSIALRTGPLTTGPSLDVAM